MTDEPEFYFPDYWRKAADNVKQGSSDEKFEFEPRQFAKIEEALIRINFEYQNLISQGACAEQVRMLLPQSMMTEWIWSGTLFAFAKMCKLRLDSHTQKETREIAQMIDKEASQLFPVSWQALMEYGE